MMSDEAIPEDVMRAATAVWRAEWRRPTVEQIAFAILAERAAERERCAKVATDTGTRLGEPAIGHAIASSIRSSHGETR